MRYTWDNFKRQKNLKKWGLDFAEAEKVFAGPTFTFEDNRIDYGEQRWVTLGLLEDRVWSSYIPKQMKKSVSFQYERPEKMNKSYSSEISDNHDDYPEITQDDIDRSLFRIGLKPSSLKKQEITVLLDTGLIEYFKAKAGENDYKILINNALKRAVEYDNLEDTLRRVIREELHHAG